MRFYSTISLVLLGLVHAVTASAAEDDGWIALFNGKDLSGWKASENKETFQVVDGEIVAHGPRSHLFYVGPIGGADFKNFEWKCEVLTKPGSNSGMYFRTKYQEKGWPTQGYEAQVNNTHRDRRKTGSLYRIADVLDNSPVKDNEWFVQQVTIQDRHIVVKVNGKVMTDFTLPEEMGLENRKMAQFSTHGTIALQGHDPGSEVHYRNVMIKLLP